MLEERCPNGFVLTTTTMKQYPYTYQPWTSTSLLIPVQQKINTLVDDLMEWSNTSSLSWLYDTNYQETYQRLLQVDAMLQQLENDMTVIHQTVKQNRSRILDLNIVIHDLPMEQYLAVFGPLLFPLIVPLCITFVREYMRYRKHKRARL